MNRALKLTRIFLPNPNHDNHYPTYQNGLQPCHDFRSDTLREMFDRHEADILHTVAHEAALYLADESCCGDDANMFPRRHDLTGEWYVQTVWMEEGERGIRLSVFACFLGARVGTAGYVATDDYLGMEAWFDYDTERGAFVFDCFDTSAL